MMELHIGGQKLCPCPQPAGTPLEVAVAIGRELGDLLTPPVGGDAVLNEVRFVRRGRQGEGMELAEMGRWPAEELLRLADAG